MKKVKLLFQGDSITDAGRDYNDYHNLGNGYPLYAAKFLEEKFPNVEFEFINLGISGHQTKDLLARLQTDFIDINPDIISILIGVNDVWHHCEGKKWLDDAIFEERLRAILSGIKENTNAKLMIMEPFIIPKESIQFFREDLYKKIEIIRKLAREYADVYMPTDGILNSAFIGDDPLTFAEDGVHPTKKGAEFIAKHYVDYISKLI